MKRKVWVSSPILYVLAVVMAGMTAASWFWNPIIFFIELALTLDFDCNYNGNICTV
ncbi:MAG: hypothetical protein ACLTE2_09505 [Eubacteriales bacterium]